MKLVVFVFLIIWIDSDGIVLLSRLNNDEIYENVQVYRDEILHSFVPEHFELRVVVVDNAVGCTMTN